MIETGQSRALRELLKPGTSLRDAALAYAANRIFVIRLGKQSKRPTNKNWQRFATTDPTEIRKLWGDHDYNVGIALALSGIAVLDIDPRNNGLETLDRLEEEHGQLPPTYIVRSGGGGLHYYYRVPADVDRSQLPQKLADGVELKKSGQVVAPPSVTEDHYIIESGSPLELAPLPFKWIHSVIGDKVRASEGVLFDEIIRIGERNDKCTQIAGLFRRYGASAEAIKAVLDGLGTHGLIEDYYEIDSESGKSFAEHDVNLISESVAKYPQEAMHFLDLKLRVNEGRVREPQTPDTDFGVLGEFLDLTDTYSEAHPMAVLVTAVTMLGNMISPYIGFSVGKTWHPPLIYALIVGPTSEGGKGQSESRCEELMDRIDPDWVMKITSGLSSGEGLIEAIADPMPTGDASRIQGKKVAHAFNRGVEDKRLMIFEPELGRLIKVLQRSGNTTMETLIDLWDRGFASKLTIQRRTVTGARISVVMHSPTVVIQEQMSYDWLMNGFGNRFLWTWAKRTHLEPLGPKIPEHQLDPIATELGDAIDVIGDRYYKRKRPLECGFTREGGEYWEELYQELSKDKYTGGLETAMGRRRSYARRLAMIFAVLDFQTKIDVNHLNSAMAIIDYNEQTLVHLFGDATGDKTADRIYRACLEHPTGLTRTELSTQVFSRNISKDQMNGAIQKLMTRGLIHETRQKRGRKSETVYMPTNPKI